MFDKSKFALIIKKIKESYSSQEEFSKISGIGRTYLSQYMNMKIDNPPKPEILKKLADASNNIISYNELMEICGYTSDVFDSMLNPIYENLKERIEKTSLTAYQKHIFCEIYGRHPNKDIHIINEHRKIISELTNTQLNEIYGIINEFYDKFEAVLKKREKQIIEELNKRGFSIPDNESLHMCPVYGKISAGIPNWAEECLEGYLPIDPNLFGIVNPDECFFLIVNGQSMNKVIRNGAYALIRKQDAVENGEICAVLVNGFEATLKKFSKQGDLVILEPMSDDPSFTTQVYNKDTQIRIIGKYIGKFEMNK